MEDAAKGLIIAGGMFITIMIISMGIYLRNNLSETSDAYIKQLETVELQKYNAYFEVYTDAERKNNITAQDIVTLVSLAQQKNQGTMVYVNGIECTQNWGEKEKNEFLEDNILHYKGGGTVEHLYAYVDRSISYNQFGKVSKISFRKIP